MRERIGSFTGVVAVNVTFRDKTLLVNNPNPKNEMRSINSSLLSDLELKALTLDHV